MDAPRRAPLSPRELDALEEKYAEISRLRRTPSLERAAVRQRMVALAARFPGALRDLDHLTLDAIDARLVEITAARAGGEAPRWMAAQLAYHRALRGALAVKRWLAAREPERVDDATRDALLRDATLDEDARAWADRLAEIASPPSGRLAPLAIARVAAELGATEGEIRALVSPPRPPA